MNVRLNPKILLKIIAISIFEIVFILWANNWVFTPAVFVPASQIMLLIEKVDEVEEKDKKD